MPPVAFAGLLGLDFCSAEYQAISKLFQKKCVAICIKYDFTHFSRRFDIFALNPSHVHPMIRYLLYTPAAVLRRH